MIDDNPDLQNDIQVLATALIHRVMAPDEEKASVASKTIEAFAEKLGDQAEVVRQSVDTTLLVLQELNQTTQANV